MPGRLINQTVYLTDGRTGIRLEPELWDAIDEICHREGIDRNGLVQRVEAAGYSGTRTGAMRVFVLGYFRSAATESGHRAAGHGPIAAGGSAKWHGKKRSKREQIPDR